MSLFAAITLVTSTAAPVVACTKDRYSTPTLSDELKNLVEAQFNQDIKDGTIDSTYTFGDIFKSNLSNMTTLAIRLINQVISRYFTNNESVTRQKNAGILNPATPDPSQYNTPFKNQITTLAKDQLYSDYVKYYETNNQLEDIDMVNKGYILLDNDPTATSASAREAAILAGKANPLIDGEYYVQQKPNTDKSKNDRPSNWDYKNWTLSTQATSEKATSSDDIKNFLFGGPNKATDGWSVENVKNTLWECYQDYYIHVELPKIIDNAITSTYLDNNYLQADQNKSSYLNYRSDLLGSMQNWPVASGSPATMQSNFKMAWKFQFNNNDIQDGPPSKIGSLGWINAEIRNAMGLSQPSGEPEPTPYAAGKDPKDLLTPQNWSPSNFNKAINDIFGVPINPSSTSSTSLLSKATKLGTNPIFADSLSNFDGFAAYGSDGKIIGSDYTPDTSYGPTLQKNANKVGFLQNGPGAFQFPDAKSTNDIDFVFALPIYAQDLLHNESYSYKDQKKWPINLRGYVGGALPKVGDNNLDWNNLSIQGGADAYKQYKIPYLYNMGWHEQPTPPTPLASNPPDASHTASFGNYTIPGTHSNNYVNPTFPIDKTKLELFNYAKYYFGQGADLATAAKTNYYSQAFDYDPKNLYDSNLYDQIGKYIIDHTDD